MLNYKERKNTMQELWKDIPNYEGKYLISENGRVKRLEKERK